MTLPSADEFLTGVSKHAHGSVDGIEDSENKKIDWRAVGAGLRHDAFSGLDDYHMKIKADDP